jgi:hypothetical protein
MIFDCRTGVDANRQRTKTEKTYISEQNPNFYLARVALVAQPTQNQLHAYSVVTGTWASLGVAVDPGDAFKGGGNTAFVAQPTQNALRAFSAITGAWASLTAPIDPGELFLVGSDA